MKAMTYIGGTHVATEPGESLSVQPLAGNHIMLQNGQRAQVKRYWSDSAIATGASDSAMIAAPPAGFYLAIVSYRVICSAATTVTFRSDSTTPEQILYCTTGVPVDAPRNGSAHFRSVAEKGIDITTSGGNTSVKMEYIEVPLATDIL